MPMQRPEKSIQESSSTSFTVLRQVPYLNCSLPFWSVWLAHELSKSACLSLLVLELQVCVAVPRYFFF